MIRSGSAIAMRSMCASTEATAYAGSGDGLPRDEVPEGVEMVIVLGGDGTLLSAARAVAGRDIPLFAVNLGGLGFLTAITVDEVFYELERALHGEQRIVPRRMLACEVINANGPVASYDALNDVVITKARARAHDRPGSPRGQALRVHL